VRNDKQVPLWWAVVVVMTRAQVVKQNRGTEAAHRSFRRRGSIPGKDSAGSCSIELPTVRSQRETRLANRWIDDFAVGIRGCRQNTILHKQEAPTIRTVLTTTVSSASMCDGNPLDTDDREHWPTFAQRGVFLRLNTLPCPYLSHTLFSLSATFHVYRQSQFA
jgi:hypothetical protein